MAHRHKKIVWVILEALGERTFSRFQMFSAVFSQAWLQRKEAEHTRHEAILSQNPRDPEKRGKRKKKMISRLNGNLKQVFECARVRMCASSVKLAPV